MSNGCPGLERFVAVYRVLRRFILEIWDGNFGMSHVAKNERNMIMAQSLTLHNYPYAKGTSQNRYSKMHFSQCKQVRECNTKNYDTPKKSKNLTSPAGFEPTRPKARPSFLAGPRVNHSTKVTCLMN